MVILDLEVVIFVAVSALPPRSSLWTLPIASADAAVQKLKICKKSVSSSLFPWSPGFSIVKIRLLGLVTSCGQDASTVSGMLGI